MPARRQPRRPSPDDPPRRRRFLDPERKEQILVLISQGCTFAEAAELVGCTDRTISREAAREPEFRRAILRATTRVREFPIALLHRAAAKHWRAAAWLLERTQPHRYAARRPAACDLPDLESACRRIIDAALTVVEDPAVRSRLQERMEQVAAQVAKDLVTSGVAPSEPWLPAPPSVSAAQIEREFLRLSIGRAPQGDAPRATVGRQVAGRHDDTANSPENSPSARQVSPRIAANPTLRRASAASAQAPEGQLFTTEEATD
jgi:hypothetical protein